jgi:predicted ArsR family transcriptional regulator
VRTDEIVAATRVIGADLHTVEIKSAARGLPTTVQRDAIQQAIRAGQVTTRALGDALGINHRTLTRRLAELVDQGLIEPTRPLRSSKQSYRLTNKESHDRIP